MPRALVLLWLATREITAGSEPLASFVLLLVVLPLQYAGFANLGFAVWAPMLVYEVWLALWLLVRGYSARDPRP